MKKNVKNILILIFLISISIGVLSGCEKNDDDSTKKQNITTEKDDNQIALYDTLKNEDSEEDKKTVPELPEMKDLLIYGIQSETLESEQVSVLVPKDSEITAEFIVEQVVNVFEDSSLLIGIDSVTVEEDKVIVSFEADKAPLVNVGSGVEATILDSFAMSLLDNLETCKKVIFRVEGEAYSSGHILLGIDEVYKWK